MVRQFAVFVVLLTVVIFASNVMPVAGNGFSGPLRMQGSVSKGADGGYYLDVIVTNDGHEPVSISAVKLPWAPDHWDSWIKGFKLDGKETPLEPGGALIDYGGQVIVKSREPLKGRVALHAMFRTLLNDIAADGVVIKWRCPTDLIPVTCSTPTSRIVISKTGIQNDTPKESIPQVK